jgi:predicted small lipoprotein YifL
MKRVLITSAIITLATLSAGCGLKGKLERPAPLWGSARESYEEQQKRDAAAAQAEREEGRTRVAIPVDNTAESSDAVDMTASQGALPPVEDMTASSPRY